MSACTFTGASLGNVAEGTGQVTTLLPSLSGRSGRASAFKSPGPASWQAGGVEQIPSRLRCLQVEGTRHTTGTFKFALQGPSQKVVQLLEFRRIIGIAQIKLTLAAVGVFAGVPAATSLPLKQDSGLGDPPSSSGLSVLGVGEAAGKSRGSVSVSRACQCLMQNLQDNLPGSCLWAALRDGCVAGGRGRQPACPAPAVPHQPKWVPAHSGLTGLPFHDASFGTRETGAPPRMNPSRLAIRLRQAGDEAGPLQSRQACLAAVRLIWIDVPAGG